MSWVNWLRAGLARRLFLANVLVIAVGVVTLVIVSGVIAPGFLNDYMTRMMGSSGHTMKADWNDPALRTAFLGALKQALWIAGGAAGLVAVVASLFVARQIAKPIHGMVGATQRIASGHYDERLSVDKSRVGDELASLANSFNDMAASLQQTEERRLALVGDVAHEMRAPITVLEGNLEGLIDGVVKSTPETWAKLHDEAGRLRRFVDDLQELSRAEAGHIPLSLTTVSPETIVQRAVERLAPQFSEKGLRLALVPGNELPSVIADGDRAVQVLTNLLTNALRYTPAPNEVSVATARDDGMVSFTVRDAGMGLSQEHLAHLFERFYRVDKSRSRASGGSGI